jgi:hypothetical protein
MIKSEAVRGFPDHAVIDDPDFKFRIACKFSAIRRRSWQFRG